MSQGQTEESRVKLARRNSRVVAAKGEAPRVLMDNVEAATSPQPAAVDQKIAVTAEFLRQVFDPPESVYEDDAVWTWRDTFGPLAAQLGLDALSPRPAEATLAEPGEPVGAEARALQPQPPPPAPLGSAADAPRARAGRRIRRAAAPVA